MENMPEEALEMKDVIVDVLDEECAGLGTDEKEEIAVRILVRLGVYLYGKVFENVGLLGG